MNVLKSFDISYELWVFEILYFKFLYGDMRIVVSQIFSFISVRDGKNSVCMNFSKQNRRQGK